MFSAGLGLFSNVSRQAQTVTPVGDAQVSTTHSPFGGIFDGASAEFDGDGDYLATPDLLLGTGEVTLEAWIRTSATVLQNIIGSYIGTTATGPGYILDLGSDGVPRARIGPNNVRGTSNLNNNAWHHIAGVRDSNGVRLYVNGVQEASIAANSQDLNIDREVRIGSLSSELPRFFNGYMDEVRVSNTARYTANFTPSTTPFVNDENTLLLLHMDGTNGSSDFVDDNGFRNQAGVSALGTAKISTTQSLFGGTSGEFDGVDSVLRVPGDVATAFGTSDFTIEAQIYATDFSTNRNLFSTLNNFATGSNLILFRLQNNGTLRLRAGAVSHNLAATSQTISTNTWTHVAAVRHNNVLNVFVNGVLDTNTGNSPADLTTFNNSAVGALFASSDPGGVFAGYMDEFRISNTARYTANFVPATAPFVNDSNTLLLLHMDGTNGSTTFLDDNGATTRGF